MAHFSVALQDVRESQTLPFRSCNKEGSSWKAFPAVVTSTLGYGRRFYQLSLLSVIIHGCPGVLTAGLYCTLTAYRPVIVSPPAKGMCAVISGSPQPLAGELSLFAKILRHAQHGAQDCHQHHQHLQEACYCENRVTMVCLHEWKICKMFVLWHFCCVSGCCDRQRLICTYHS